MAIDTVVVEIHCGSGDTIHVISEDHVIKGPCDFMEGSPHDKIPPSQIGSHIHCSNRDLMFLVAEEQDSTCARLNPPLLFSGGLEVP